MIVSSDIVNILYHDCEVFGIDIVPDGEILVGELSVEKITIHPKEQESGTYWKKSFVEVNIYVPDLSENIANSIRLGRIERQVQSVLDDILGSYDGTTYSYKVSSMGRKEDLELKCHYVSIKILFEVLNIK